ncbi:hypothetical protein BH18ACT14_BH18ACT14_17160 [soil metagenome]
MTFWSDMDSEMQPLPLESDTADRLLAGLVAPEGAPAGYGRVVRLLEAASAEASSEELAREPETVAAMAAALRLRVHRNPAASRRSFVPFALSRPRLTAAVLAAAFAASCGMASAGSLPGAAQDVASEMLAKVGITVPGANETAGTRPDVRGNSASVPSRPAHVGKGSDISELATTTELTGIEKGAAISTAASGGKSRAGQHGSASGAGAPVETPNGGGTDTADTASGGKSSTGTSTANTASGGKSSAGSGNASSGQETADAASDGRSSEGQSHRP